MQQIGKEVMKRSAGLLIYRVKGQRVEVLLVHPAGPFWGKKDMWSIPKGETEENEELLAAAKREFGEETGFTVPEGQPLDLGSANQSNKKNFIWALEGDFELGSFVCKSTFTMEWPPHSGKEEEFTENDRATWFDLPTACRRIFKNQAVFLERLAEQLKMRAPGLSLDPETDSAEPRQSRQASLF